jgi:dihydrofolate synthase/folylpolyglutamate synthase
MTTYAERMTLNGQSISEDDFVNLYRQLHDGGHADQLTEFECLTVMSFVYFVGKQPDVVIYETGLGGRLDATNVVWPTVTVLTRIGLDHQDILGETIEQIASEKAGIIKPGVPVVTTAHQPREAEEVILDTAARRSAPVVWVQALDALPRGGRLSADYQKENAAIAFRAATLLASHMGAALTDAHVEQGLKNATIWGRFMKGEINGRPVILDGAHNPDGARALVSSLQQEGVGGKSTFLVGILRTKSAEEFLSLLNPVAQTIYYCEFDPLRCYTIADIRALGFQVLPWSHRQPLPSGDPLVITGSLYFLSQFHDQFLHQPPDDRV